MGRRALRQSRATAWRAALRWADAEVGRSVGERWSEGGGDGGGGGVQLRRSRRAGCVREGVTECGAEVWVSGAGDGLLTAPSAPPRRRPSPEPWRRWPPSSLSSVCASHSPPSPITTFALLFPAVCPLSLAALHSRPLFAEHPPVRLHCAVYSSAVRLIHLCALCSLCFSSWPLRTIERVPLYRPLIALIGPESQEVQRERTVWAVERCWWSRFTRLQRPRQPL